MPPSIELTNFAAPPDPLRQDGTRVHQTQSTREMPPDATICDVFIYDELSASAEESECSSWYRFRNRVGGNQATHERLLEALQNRIPSKDRWINVIGWSPVVNDIASAYLGEPDLLKVDGHFSRITHGSVRDKGGFELVCLHTDMFFAGDGDFKPSAIQKANIRIILCIPGPESAGTLITHFPHRADAAERVSHSIAQNATRIHPQSGQGLKSLWTAVFSTLGCMVEQSGLALDALGSDSPGQAVTELDQILSAIGKMNRLTEMCLYLSNLEETATVLTIVQKNTYPNTTGDPGDISTIPLPFREQMASCIVLNQLRSQNRACRLYMQQLDSAVQKVISYKTALAITEVAKGGILIERMTKIGLSIAAITGVIAPLGLLTSFFGMNVQEFTPDAKSTLFDFWKLGLSTVLVTTVGLTFIGMWIWQ